MVNKQLKIRENMKNRGLLKRLYNLGKSAKTKSFDTLVLRAAQKTRFNRGVEKTKSFAYCP